MFDVQLSINEPSQSNIWNRPWLTKFKKNEIPSISYFHSACHLMCTSLDRFIPNMLFLYMDQNTIRSVPHLPFSLDALISTVCWNPATWQPYPLKWVDFLFSLIIRSKLFIEINLRDVTIAHQSSTNQHGITKCHFLFCPIMLSRPSPKRGGYAVV